MADQWFVQRDGKKFGPMPTAKLKHLAASGKLKPTDQVQKQGMDRFVRAGAIKGLFPGVARRLGVSDAPAPTRPVDDANSDPEAEAGTNARKSGWASGARLGVVAATAAVLLMGTLIAAGIGLSMRASSGKNSSNKENQSASRSADSISPLQVKQDQSSADRILATQVEDKDPRPCSGRSSRARGECSCRFPATIPGRSTIRCFACCCCAVSRGPPGSRSIGSTPSFGQVPT